MKKRNVKEENKSQAEAFRHMHGDELELIRAYAADFRDIINQFEAAIGRVPTAEELLWIERDATLPSNAMSEIPSGRSPE